jgi:hypothetical protein
MYRMLNKLVPLAAAVVVVLASAGAQAQLGAGSLNPGMPGVSPPAPIGGFSSGERAPGPTSEMPAQSGLNNPRISNYGAGGLQREPGSLPRFH